jgi:hypothetical protein
MGDMVTQCSQLTSQFGGVEPFLSRVVRSMDGRRVGTEYRQRRKIVSAIKAIKAGIR